MTVTSAGLAALERGVAQPVHVLRLAAVRGCDQRRCLDRRVDGWGAFVRPLFSCDAARLCYANENGLLHAASAAHNQQGPSGKRVVDRRRDA